MSKTLRTTNDKVYAAGDCCSQYQFTHNSDVQARTVIYNSLLFKSLSVDDIHLPWSTYTDPEIATVGKTEAQLREAKTAYQVFKRDFSEVDRALCDSTKGFYKVLTKRGSAQILGATFVGGPAGDLISMVTMGMKNGLDLSKVGAGVSPYPSYSDAVKNLTDQYNKTKLTPS